MASYKIANMSLPTPNFQDNAQHIFSRNGNHVAAPQAFTTDQENAAKVIAHPIVLGCKDQ